jgi:hypothetical protein
MSLPEHVEQTLEWLRQRRVTLGEVIAVATRERMRDPRAEQRLRAAHTESDAIMRAIDTITMAGDP